VLPGVAIQIDEFHCAGHAGKGGFDYHGRPSRKRDNGAVVVGVGLAGQQQGAVYRGDAVDDGRDYGRVAALAEVGDALDQRLDSRRASFRRVVLGQLSP
jgi:hypothetical protein